MSEKISPAEVIQMIRDLVTSKQTATLYIHTDRNRMVMVATKDGQLWTKKIAKDAKEFKKVTIEGLHLLENFVPTCLKLVPSLNTLV